MYRGDGVLERLWMRRHQRQLHHLRVEDHRIVRLYEHRLDGLDDALGRAARPVGVHGEAATVLVARQVRPARGDFAGRREHRARTLGDAYDGRHHGVELALRGVTQPRHELWPQHVHRLIELRLGHTPRIVRGPATAQPKIQHGMLAAAAVAAALVLLRRRVQPVCTHSHTSSSSLLNW